MNKTSYTPGPWTLTATVETGRKNLFGSDFHVGTLVSGSRQEIGTFKANARLIAAAPELLEALEMIASDYTYLLDTKMRPQDAEAIQCVVAKVAKSGITLDLAEGKLVGTQGV